MVGTSWNRAVWNGAHTRGRADRLLDAKPSFRTVLDSVDAQHRGVLGIPVQHHAAAGVFLDDAVCGHAYPDFGGAALRPHSKAVLAANGLFVLGQSAYPVCLRTD